MGLGPRDLYCEIVHEDCYPKQWSKSSFIQKHIETRVLLFAFVELGQLLAGSTTLEALLVGPAFFVFAWSFNCVVVYCHMGRVGDINAR